ncbi:MAG: hypothetical protein RLZZ464_42 [Pseudomonadota bacterium]|jgi:uncharacterized protein (TIGR02646 family)
MRPIQRGDSPQATDFANYEDAKPFLVSRLGRYCSYCERRVQTNLAVEHIQPKGLKAYEPLAGRWDNFLLGCVNCNSTKKNKDVVLSEALLPDRDNTAMAYDYLADGQINVAMSVPAICRPKADSLLQLVGLDKPISEVLDENGKQVALDRVSQRMDLWGIALDTKQDVDDNPGNEAVRRGAVRTAVAEGFFSIWMIVFASDTDMRLRLINAFPGTRGSGCFDPTSGLPIQPAPNPDNLANGGKL